MKGWKTTAAGVGTILLGISQIVLAFAKPEMGTSLETGMQTVLGGLAVIGIGHKLDKAS